MACHLVALGHPGQDHASRHLPVQQPRQIRADLVNAPTAILRPLSALRSAQDAGGKAWSLARMAREGVAVPPGMVLGCTCFDRFVQEHGLGTLETEPGLDLEDWPRFSERAAQIRRQVMACSLPAEVDRTLRDWWTDAGHSWIVRSSAVGEDSAAASFAGQLDSVLHVDSLAGLREAILRCWASY